MARRLVFKQQGVERLYDIGADKVTYPPRLVPKGGEPYKRSRPCWEVEHYLVGVDFLRWVPDDIDAQLVEIDNEIASLRRKRKNLLKVAIVYGERPAVDEAGRVVL